MASGGTTTRPGRADPAAAALSEGWTRSLGAGPARGPGSCCWGRLGSFEVSAAVRVGGAGRGLPPQRALAQPCPTTQARVAAGRSGRAARDPALPPSRGVHEQDLAGGDDLTGAACRSQRAACGRVGVGAWGVAVPGAAPALAGRGDVRSRPRGTAATLPRMRASEVGFGQGRACRARHGWALSAAAGASSLVGWERADRTKGVKPPGVAPGRPAAVGTSQARKRRSRPERYTPVGSGPHGTPACSTRTGGTQAGRGARPRTAAGRRPGPGCGPVQPVATSSGSDAAEQVRRSCQRSRPHRPCRPTARGAAPTSRSVCGCCPKDPGPQRPPGAVRVPARRGRAGRRTTTPSKSV